MSAPKPDRDCVVLDRFTFRAIRRRSAPKVRDTSLDEERAALKRKHDRTVELTSQWPNTIIRNRIDRQTRLQKEKEAAERRQIAIDDEEKKIQKLKTNALLAQARSKGFLQRKEVRDVNRQILYEEVLRERDAQQMFREKRRIAEEKRQAVEDQKYREQYEQMVEREKAIRTARRERNLRNAEELRTQRTVKMDEAHEKREMEMTDEMILSELYSKLD